MSGNPEQTRDRTGALALSLDTTDLLVPDLRAAADFYRAVLGATVDAGQDHVLLDLHGAGRLALRPAPPAEEGAADDVGPAGCVLSYVVAQPSEVQAVLAAAERGGATVLKPARRGFFGGFSAAFRSPDGTVWKLAAPSRKDTGPAGEPPVPTEVIAILAVEQPTASKAFYEALGMSADHDYGDKFVDFRLSPGTFRLALMPGKALAKDVGGDLGEGGRGTVRLAHRTGSPGDVETLLAAAERAGGQVTAAAGSGPEDGCVGRFTDPDGHRWTVTG